MSRVPRHGRMLILSHRDELVHQPEKYFDCSFGVEQASETSHGEEVVSASVQSLVRRLDKFKPDDFDVLITDECFVGQTLIDGVPIREIKVGDYIRAFNHETGDIERRKVIHVFKRFIPNKMIKINGELICTLNHPIYEVKQGRYINARDIKVGDRLLSRSFIKNNEQNEQEICVRTNEKEKSNEQSRNKRKNGYHTSRDRTQTAYSRWQRSWINKTAGVINGATYGIKSSERICCGNRSGKNKCRALSITLQNRYCHPRSYARNRDKRRKPLFDYKEIAGFEKRKLLEIKRVDSVEILEQGSNEKYSGLCSDGFVYNLEVEGLNNYFANGILVHNCHHATAPSYRKIYDYFKPRLHLGFTATPNRNDGVGLKEIYQDIIFERNMKWGIENGYLSDIHCLRVELGYDLRRVATRLGDYAPEALDRAVNIESANDAIRETYKLYAKPPCLIFCASVAHAENLARLIDGAVAVKGGEDRSEIVKAFKAGEIPCLTNCMVFTEGTDIPNINTVIMARPTKNISLYQQAVGRAVRLYPGKEYSTLIDCVGAGDEADFCTAPSLLGLDIKDIPPKLRKKIQGDLFDLPEIVDSVSDVPEVWIKNVQRVELWSRRNNYDTHGINFFRMADGSMVVQDIHLPPEDSLGRIEWRGRLEPAQKVFDAVYELLRREYSENRKLWDLDLAKGWGSYPATEKQKSIIAKKVKDFDASNLTRFEAAEILTRLFAPQPPTKKQVYFLQSRGYDVTNMTRNEASRIIGSLKGD